MKQKLVTIAKILISAILLGLLFTRIDFQDLMARYSQIHLGYLLVGLFILSLQTFWSSIKWWLLLKADQRPISLLFLWKTYLIGNFLGLFLPTSIGGDFYRIYALRSANSDLGKSTSSVLFDRLSGLFALISIAFISSLFLPGNPYNLLMVAVYVAGILAFFAITSDAALRRLERVELKIFRPALKILRSFNTYRSNQRVMIWVFIISFLFQLNIVVLNKLYTLSLGIQVPFSQLLVIIPLIYLTEVLPISINGLGVRESAFAFFFQLVGRTPEEGLAVSLLVVFLRYMVGMIGGLLFLRESLAKRKQLKAAPGDSSNRIVT